MGKLYYFSEIVSVKCNEVMVPISQAYHGYKGIDAETDAWTLDRWSLDAAGRSWGEPLCLHSLLQLPGLETPEGNGLEFRSLPLFDDSRRP